MSAQGVGQWLGLVAIVVTVSAIGFGLLQILLSVRDYFRRREFYREAARKVGENIARNFPAPPMNLTVGGRVMREHRDENGVRVIDAVQLSSVSPVFHRGEYPRVVVQSARQGGKTEAMRIAALQADPLCTPYNLRPYLFGGSSLDSMAAGLIIRQATKSNRPPGEIAIGVALDLERDFLDGDRPSITEPRGIFNS